MTSCAGTHRPGTSCGFTLLEVLVALAVMSFALAALWKVLDQGIAITDALPDRVAARWVAQNRLVLRQAEQRWPAPEVYKGHEELAGKTWYWEEEISSTGEPALRRITVTVGRAPDALTLVSLEGFLRQPDGS